MKHTLPVTLILITVFIASQLLGLGLIALDSSVVVNEDGTTSVNFEDTALGERPDTQGFGSFTYLVIGIAIGTMVLLVLVHFKLTKVWRLWFFLAVWMAITVALGALMNQWVAVGFGLVLAAWKIFKPNIIIHNLTEVLVYSGIALLIVPLFEMFYVSLLFIVMAVYDAYAVWKSKHMVKMAKFQTESSLFAGLLIPYQTKTVKMSKKPTLDVKAVSKTTEGKSAILGGGDIAFPLLFCGVVFNTLLMEGLSKGAAYSLTLIVVIAAAVSLALLFVTAKKDKFYPAIPYLATGCFVGYGLMRLAMMLF